jgi:ubiquinol-cytochrome c reductase cytochrome b subunit
MNVANQVWGWLDDRLGLSRVIDVLFYHPAPPGVGWMYVFGSNTFFAFLLQAVTGIALLTTYVAAGGSAYQSLQYITNDAVFGRVLRGMHFFGASAMVVSVGVHMTRVFLTGAFKFPREANWLTGSLLLLLTIGQAFTGEVMRFDQTAVWATVIAAQMAGRVPFIGDAVARLLLSGQVVGATTLSRFFALHAALIPGTILAVIGVHLYLVVRNGITEPPKVGRPVDPKTYRAWYKELLERSGVPFWPDIAWRDVVFAVSVIGIVIVLAIVFGGPRLSQPPDPAIVQAVPRPDWYLLWYFAVLALMPPGIEAYIMVGAPLLLIVGLIAVPLLASRGERHPARRPWAVLFVAIAVTAIGVLTWQGATSPWSPDFEAQPLPEQVIGISSGPVYEGGQLFNQRGCEYCHTVDGYGGTRGPNLSTIGDRWDTEQLTVQILHGGINMPAFGSILKPSEVQALVAFLESRKSP